MGFCGDEALHEGEATQSDRRFLKVALEEAQKGYDEGGVPVGAAMVEDGEIIGSGHNRRVQEGDPIAHGEMDCLRRAGRRRSYRKVTLYTTLSPCMMCSGTILQFGSAGPIPEPKTKATSG